MALSLFDDDDVDNLLNNDLNENQDLPSDDEHKENDGNDGNLFGEEENDGGEDNAVKVEPKKRSVRNTRPKLTVETLRGLRGIQTIEDYFKDIKFKGKGNERYNLDEIMRRLQHWGHRMYPTYKFDDILANIERLGKKKPLQVHMSRYRLGMLSDLQLAENNAMEDDEDVGDAAVDEPFDEFDALLGEQIAISKLVPRTPASSSNPRQASTNTTLASSTFTTPSFERTNLAMSTPYTGIQHNLNDSDLATPLPPSQPDSEAAPPKKLTAEQMAKIAENRRLAQERLRARQQQQQQII